ncbi:MAG: LLM class F420-dependent oxidoreductase [Pseudomonadota bacterium]
MTMQIGATVAYSHYTQPEFVAASARYLEELGFHSIWVPEHVLFFPDYESRYPYTEGGRLPGDPEGVLDPFTALTFVAAHTSTLRLGTGICLVPQRQPVYTAKMVADLDYLSGGRVDFGVGIGWLKEEFDSLQMSFADRAANTVEYLDAMRALWSPGVTAFEGPTLRIAPCHFNPKPVQTPHPPVYFGGESDAALRRVARHGQGWYGYNMTPETVEARLGRLEALLAAEGRLLADVHVCVGPNRHPITPETVAAYEAAGVAQLNVPVGGRDLDGFKRRAEKMATICGVVD